MQKRCTPFLVSAFCILNSAFFRWCERGDSNPHGFGPRDPKSRASANSATFAKVPGAPTRTRTWNQQIKSLLLYQLSYGGVGSFLTPSDTELFLSSGRGFYCGASRSYSMRSARRM